MVTAEHQTKQAPSTAQGPMRPRRWQAHAAWTLRLSSLKPKSTSNLNVERNKRHFCSVLQKEKYGFICLFFLHLSVAQMPL